MNLDFWRRPSTNPLPIVIAPDFTHASHPTVIHVKDNRFFLVFASRDKSQRSHLFGTFVNVNNGAIAIESNIKALATPGSVGTFDCDGILPCNFVKDGENIFLYYCGWQNLPETRWICDSGRFIVDTTKATCDRQFNGPIFGRNKDNPLFAVMTAVYKKSDGDWITWYNKGISWNLNDKRWEAKYGVHIALSSDGVTWDSKEGLVIPFLDDQEHSFGRPTVLFEGNKFHMWFGCRGSAGMPEYKLGYASSINGVDWKRQDSLSGVTPSGSNWDSHAVTYPSVFRHQNFIYMLYCGNNYGKTGFGYAFLNINDFHLKYI